MDEIAQSCSLWSDYVAEGARKLAEYDTQPVSPSVWPVGRQLISAAYRELMNLRANTQQTLSYSMAPPDDRQRLELMVENTVQETTDLLRRWERWLDTHRPAPPPHPPGWQPPPPPRPPRPSRPTLDQRAPKEIFGFIGTCVGVALIIVGLFSGLEKVHGGTDGQKQWTTNDGAAPFFIGILVVAIGLTYWAIGYTERVHGTRAANMLAFGITAASVGHIAYMHHYRQSHPLGQGRPPQYSFQQRQ